MGWCSRSPSESTVKPIRTILAATDFSFSAHRAARRAGMLAKEHDCALHLLHVLDSSPIQALRSAPPGIDVEKPLVYEAERGLDSLAEDVATATGAASARIVREGRVMDEIRKAASSADLVVLGPRGINPLRDLFLGSTAERMARSIERPMLIVKQEPQITYDHVLVPVDFSDYSLPSIRFARALAPKATLHVFHAIHGSLEKTLLGAGVSDDGIASYLHDLRHEALANMTGLQGQMNDPKLLPVVNTGDARALIPEYASASGCSLIVLGKQGRSWLAEQILGSVCRYVLEHVNCDVAIVPHG
jgi:nucleotide-binding universal stress UspA family protein